VLDELAQSAGLNRTKGWQPIRAAVTGSNVSPPLPESLARLGRERTLARLSEA
jgi:glutamyl-tRNA synthetase